MSASKGKGSAEEILRRRYVGTDARREASLQDERANAEVARLIYDLRTGAELSQKELAELVGTTQSVISRLEDADYEGHSLSMLNRIARAVDQRLVVTMTAADPNSGAMRYAFNVILENLRKSRGLTVDAFAARTQLDRNEILAMERSPGYRPSPLALHKLGKFYGIPQRRLAELAGAVREVPSEVREQASRFAAKSESFAKLSKDEKKLLDEFVRFLKSEA